LLTRYKIRNLRISAYHPQSNGLVERGHGPIVNSLAKFKDRPGTWVDHLHLALWADRVSVRRSTGYTAFELLYGRDCILPVELSIASWSMVDWNDVRTREDLILARMRQLEARVMNDVVLSAYRTEIVFIRVGLRGTASPSSL
jgi:hypothetical protein